MIIKKRIREGSFIERPNRFLTIVDLNGDVVRAYLPNPGRMHELLIPGKSVFVRENPALHRKTDFDLIAVIHNDIVISVDSNLPNRFIRNLLLNRELEMFDGYNDVKSEPQAYGGRFDFRLEGSGGVVFIEVKSCTLVENGRALFPDAVTRRGARHMMHLSEALANGLTNRAAVLFIIQRPDALVFSSNDPADPDFGEALRYAEKSGVEIIPLATEVVNWELELKGIIPYELDYWQTGNRTT